MTLRVLHLVGSPTSEFYCDLSRLYARDCLAATADPALYEFFIGYVTPDGQWRFPRDLSEDAISQAPPMSLAEAVARLVALQLDVMVPQMFCVRGMTAYRALFDVLAIPYLGNTPDVMALGAHKSRAKAVVTAAGVNVPAGELLRPGEIPTIPTPAVVKPVDTDNSVGVTLVRAPADYPQALETAFENSPEVLVESFIELGREVRCGIIAGDGELMCLPLEEYNVDRDTKPIRGYGDKIGVDNRGAMKLMAKDETQSWIVDPADPITQRVWEAAKACHSALGCRHYSLFDFRIDPAGQVWFLEAGLYCSFARQSVIAVMAQSAGISVTELFATAIKQTRQERGAAV